MPQSILSSHTTLLNKGKYPFELQFYCISAPNHRGKHFDPPPPHNQANAHLNLDNSSLNKCPKPSWQAIRPLPPKKNGQYPKRLTDIYRGASLTTLQVITILQILMTFQVLTALQVLTTLQHVQKLFEFSKF